MRCFIFVLILAVLLEGRAYSLEGPFDAKILDENMEEVFPVDGIYCVPGDSLYVQAQYIITEDSEPSGPFNQTTHCSGGDGNYRSYYDVSGWTNPPGTIKNHARFKVYAVDLFHLTLIREYFGASDLNHSFEKLVQVSKDGIQNGETHYYLNAELEDIFSYECNTAPGWWYEEDKIFHRKRFNVRFAGPDGICEEHKEPINPHMNPKDNCLKQ